MGVEDELLSPMVEQTGWRDSRIDELNGNDRQRLCIDSFYAVHCCCRWGLDFPRRAPRITGNLQLLRSSSREGFRSRVTGLHNECAFNVLQELSSVRSEVGRTCWVFLRGFLRVRSLGQSGGRLVCERVDGGSGA